jgi:hypothetical protein
MTMEKRDFAKVGISGAMSFTSFTAKASAGWGQVLLTRLTKRIRVLLSGENRHFQNRCGPSLRDSKLLWQAMMNAYHEARNMYHGAKVLNNRPKTLLHIA